MIYAIELFEGQEPDSWDSYVHSHPAGTYYHLSGWKSIVAQAYGHPTYFWLCRDTGGRVVGLLPTVNIKHFLFTNSLVSMPFLDGGGILADNPEVSQKLLATGLELALARNIPLIELRYLTREQPSQGEPIATPSSHVKVQMILPLPGNSEVLFKNFKAKLRSQIRKPMKEGLSFKLGGLEKVADFYQVFLVNMRNLGSPVHSKTFFVLMAEILKDYFKVGVVYLKDKPVAAGIIFGFRDTVYIPWASSLRGYNHLSPNMLLYWELLKYAADTGYHFFNFGRSSIYSSTYHFKAQWGALPRALEWQYPKHKKSFELPQGKEKFSMLIKIWQKLPVPVTRLIGPMIRKYIAL